MKRMHHLPALFTAATLFAATLFAAALFAASGAAAATADPPVSFKLDVYPILDARCVSCHRPGGEGLEKSGLDLTSYQGLMRGTKYGAIVVPGAPFTSNLNVLIEGRAAPQIQMPFHGRPLLRAQQKIISDWVEQGAKDN